MKKFFKYLLYVITIILMFGFISIDTENTPFFYVLGYSFITMIFMGLSVINILSNQKV